MRKALILAVAIVAMAIALPVSAKSKKKNKAADNPAPEEIVIDQPVLTSAADSAAWLFGYTQSQGLKNYIMTELKVDTAYLGAFVLGLQARIEAETEAPEDHAFNAGMEIGAQVVKMTKQFRDDYYAVDPGAKVSPALVTAALLEGFLGRSELVPDSAMKTFRTIMSDRQKENLAAQYGGNRELGEEFLAQNKKRDGVIVLPSGLQYRIIEQGEGPVPTATQKVKVNYEGHLVDGTEFDSSYKRKQPATFAVNRVIKGWTEALCKMPVGSKWELFVPQELAYGDRETGKIKPFSALIFTIELISIEE